MGKLPTIENFGLLRRIGKHNRKKPRWPRNANSLHPFHDALRMLIYPSKLIGCSTNSILGSNFDWPNLPTDQSDRTIPFDFSSQKCHTREMIPMISKEEMQLHTICFFLITCFSFLGSFNHVRGHCRFLDRFLSRWCKWGHR